MRVSDVISNVTKQNMNVMASTSTSPCKCKICISSIESDVYNKKENSNVCREYDFYFISWSVIYYIRAFDTHDIYIFSLHSMK